ncbi:hypothetical protein PIB30_003211 [Stylosanthes scabra]|uniref:Uncharacterized protein n=1 Tax=Stylosanthes scabra TaxID=79078 RepID=A0ABU6Q352_9FABA|nr:hypothetical protein [Stylosanthes scabra]
MFVSTTEESSFFSRWFSAPKHRACSVLAIKQTTRVPMQVFKDCDLGYPDQLQKRKNYALNRSHDYSEAICGGFDCLKQLPGQEFRVPVDVMVRIDCPRRPPPH